MRISDKRHAQLITIMIETYKSKILQNLRIHFLHQQTNKQIDVMFDPLNRQCSKTQLLEALQDVGMPLQGW